jgi:hypothetical protein
MVTSWGAAWNGTGSDDEKRRGRPDRESPLNGPAQAIEGGMSPPAASSWDWYIRLVLCIMIDEMVFVNGVLVKNIQQGRRLSAVVAG